MDTARPLPFYALLWDLFEQNVFSVETALGAYRASSALCFRHIRWGRGTLYGYSRDLLPFDAQCQSLSSSGLIPPSVQKDIDAAAAAAAAGKEMAASALTAPRLLEMPKSHFERSYPLIAGDGIAYQQHWSDKTSKRLTRAMGHRTAAALSIYVFRSTRWCLISFMSCVLCVRVQVASCR